MHFDQCLDSSTDQPDVDKAVGHAITGNLVEGFNSTFFAYGQTLCRTFANPLSR